METNVEIKKALDWQTAGEFSDILYDKAEGIAKLTINRPRVRKPFNSFAKLLAMPVKIRQSASLF